MKQIFNTCKYTVGVIIAKGCEKVQVTLCGWQRIRHETAQCFDWRCCCWFCTVFSSYLVSTSRACLRNDRNALTSPGDVNNGDVINTVNEHVMCYMYNTCDWTGHRPRVFKVIVQSNNACACEINGNAKQRCTHIGACPNNLPNNVRLMGKL